MVEVLELTLRELKDKTAADNARSAVWQQPGATWFLKRWAADIFKYCYAYVLHREERRKQGKLASGFTAMPLFGKSGAQAF